jgi:hypothetical protein
MITLTLPIWLYGAIVLLAVIGLAIVVGTVSFLVEKLIFYKRAVK